MLEYDGVRLLIDAGLSARQTRARMAAMGRDPEGLTGILVTHEHSDHIGGLAVLAAKARIPVYCNRLTREAIEAAVKVPLEFRVFATGSRFGVGSVEVDAFPVPHDAMDPVGFVFRTGAGDVGWVTDLGHVTKLVMERLRTAGLVALESNHDLKLLQEDLRRPWSLKQRILSRHGHLSNDSAAEALVELAAGGLRAGGVGAFEPGLQPSGAGVARGPREAPRRGRGPCACRGGGSGRPDAHHHPGRAGGRSGGKGTHPMFATLILIDIQNDYFPGGRMELEGAVEAGRAAGGLLAFFREHRWPVIHVQHESVQPGASFFLPGSPGMEIHASVAPRLGEPVVVKHFPNSFRATTLPGLLEGRVSRRLVLAGMMTHMCVDATTRAAADFGWECVVAQDALRDPAPDAGRADCRGGRCANGVFWRR